MIDIYRFKQIRRSATNYRAILLVLVAFLFAVPASGQTSVFQFTGLATGEVEAFGGGLTNFTSKLVSLQFSGPSTNSGTVGAGPETFFSLGGGTAVVIVDGITYALDATVGAMTLRSPDADGPPDNSSYLDADTEIDFEDAGDLITGTIAIHYESGGVTGSEYYHVFEKFGGGSLAGTETDFTTAQSNLSMQALEQNRGGFIGTGFSGGGPKGSGYPRVGGGFVRFDFLGGVVSYTAFTGTGGLDFGDAPDTSIGTGLGDYQTEALDAGASHFVGGPYLGTEAPDSETGGSGDYLTSAGDLDDNTGAPDDEDGVLFLTPFVSSTTNNTASLSVTVVGGTPDDGDLQAWIDFDRDGIFETSEKVIDEVDVTDGTHVYPVTVPAGASVGLTYARFRISTSGTPSSFGLAPDGEVEDHPLMILNDSEAPTGIDLRSLSDDDNPILIKRVGDDTKVFVGTVPAVEIFSAPFVSVGALAVTGTAGSDAFEIDYTSGKVANGAVTLDGQGDDGQGDSIALLAGGVANTIHHTYYDQYSGNIVFTPQPSFETVNYSDFEPITDNMSATHRIFSFNSSANDIDLIFGTPTSTINTTATSESTTFTNPSSTVTINGNGAGDTFDVEPSTAYTIAVNGDAPTTMPGDTFNLNANSLAGSVEITLVESSTTAGTYSFGSGVYLDVTYASMETVGMRLSDPNAFSGSTYEGDHFYPIHTESGISVEPYFNWDIEKWPTTGDAALANITMSISLSSDLSSPVFSTTTNEDASKPLTFIGTGDLDHYITDTDNDTGIPLLNDTVYYWGLTVLMDGGDTFKQIGRFQTIDELMPSNTYPEDELIIYDNEFVFSWNVAASTADDVYWRLDIDETSTPPFDGSSPSVSGGDSKNDDDTAGSDGYSTATTYNTSSLSSPLVDGGTYSWRVTTMWPVPPTGWVPQEIHDLDETDRTVSISAVAEFDIAGQAVSAPTPSWPTGGATVYTLNPTLNWFTGGPFDGLTFTVNLTTVAAPTVTVYTATGITGLSQELPSGTLSGSTAYRWTVVSTDGTSTSPTSADALFTTYTPTSSSTPVTPTPSYPVDDLEIYTTAPTFHWFTESDNDGQTFKVWYKKRTGPSAPVSCDALRPGDVGVAGLGPVSVTQLDVTGLEPGETYDWCVESTATGGSLESDVVSFSVGGGSIDAIPIASWPIGNPTVYALSQQLNWYVEGSSLAITTFDVQYCDDSGYTTNCTTVTGIVNQYYDLTGLNYGQQVFWRVRANYAGGGQSSWADTRSQGTFTVTGALGALTAELTYPIDDLVVASPGVTFSWYVNGSLEAATMFIIEYSYTETFTTIGTVTKSATTSETEYTVTDLIPGHTYWWRVKISNDSGSNYGSWSTVKSFSVAPGAAPVTPRIGSPANQVIVVTGSPTLSWSIPSRSESVLTYEVAFGRAADLSDATTVTGIDATHFRVTDLSDGTYYWQVLSRTADGSPSALSSIGQFEAFGTSTDVEDEVVEIPDEYRLDQNYPNPFNPTTTIEYSVPVTTEVSITVYNVLGQVVRILVNGQVQAGVHRVEWDARDETGRSLTSGLYIYRIQTADYSQARTLVLLK